MSEKICGSEIFVVWLLLTGSGMNSMAIKLFRIQEIEKNLASTCKLCNNFSWVGFFKGRRKIVS